MEKAAAVEVWDAWRFKSSLRKAVDIVARSRALIRRSEEVNAPYSI
jgi:hypothetical protein